jgi:alkaline phosphatase
MVAPGPVLARVAGAGKRVRGVVFMVSDGMSHGVLGLAEALARQERGRPSRWWQLLGSPAAVHGLMDTGSADSLVTDSAAAASAWGGGQRVPNGRINVTAEGRRIEPIAATLHAANGRIGLVTTATVTHATPAGFAANVPERAAEEAIAPQYLERVEVVLGGGAQFFEAGRRRDRRDLCGDFARAGYAVVRTRDELAAARGRRLLGLFGAGHLPFTVDRMHDAGIQRQVPTLAEMAAAALARMLDGEAPFLLQVEGARVDHAAHANDIAGLLWDQLAFDEAIGVVLSALAGREDVLVVITSDHGNANPGLNGIGAGYRRTNEHFARIARMQASHAQIFGEWSGRPGGAGELAGLIERRLGFRPTGEEAAALLDVLTDEPVVEWNHMLENPPGILGQLAGNHTGIGWTGTTHTADPTIITAIGPGAERFQGLIRNDAVHGKLLELLIG